MKFNCKYIFFILFSIIISDNSKIYEILDKSFNRLKGQDISFDCELKIQSISKDPTELKFLFYSNWLDSLNFYSYLKFTSPVDFKGTEVWSHQSDDVVFKRRMPLNKEIITVENDLEGLDIINFLNFDEMFTEIKKNELSIKNTKLGKEDIYLIKSFKNKNKRKVVKFYVSKNNYNILKVEWTNKRGALNKILAFENWDLYNNKKISKNIIYEDIKKGIKTTCKLSNISLDKLSIEQLELIKLGFKN